MSRPRLLGLSAVLALLAGGLALVWNDVLPGGWKLRGLVRSHHLRRAEEEALQRAERLALFEAENLVARPGSVVFLGSSTIERFPLRELFPGVACLDRGIGNESAALLLDRLEASLPAAPPAGAVLYLASIDFRVHGRSPEWIERIAAHVVSVLRTTFPDLPVTLIGILPEREMPAEDVQRLRGVNSALAAFCTREKCGFVATDRPPLTAADGSLAAACAADRLHLNGEGYRALARWLREDGGVVGALLTP